MPEPILNPPEPTPVLPAPTLPADAVRSLESLISRSGGSDATNVLLFNDNKELRDELRDLKTKVPKDGAVVFSKEDADALVAYRALGQPDELGVAVTERDDFKAQSVKAAKSKARDEAVKLSGYDPEKFGVLGFANEYEYSTEGETAYATREVDGKVEKKPITEIITERAGSMADALKAGNSAQSSKATFVKQGVNGSNPTNVYERVRNEVKQKEEAQKPEARDLSRAGIS